jgi:hypothetical protein
MLAFFAKGQVFLKSAYGKAKVQLQHLYSVTKTENQYNPPHTESIMLCRRYYNSIITTITTLIIHITKVYPFSLPWFLPVCNAYHRGNLGQKAILGGHFPS